MPPILIDELEGVEEEIDVVVVCFTVFALLPFVGDDGDDKFIFAKLLNEPIAPFS